ncbi:hypothetical protein NQ315_012943 [Exocentrus adspersus]|uniref:Phospholipase A2-like domain-containing protein n=1 Tax=Exocentrus adspersus TaxID=1586481 RepID=A0AAV8VSB9_9CUCU|nr:hypothetical protein NQ315_012943 [Exocentrus adspersus]
MSTTARKSGSGILDSVINNLPVELHIPGYRFCGPGTKLAKRLSRGDVGINGLDEACKEHDIAYSREKNLEQRHKADQNLGEKALKRFKSSNASIGEKAAALAVATAMKVKTKLGMGCVNEKTKKRRDVTKQARVALKGKNVKNMKDAIKVALKAVNKAKKKKKFIKAVRVIPIPKTGGFLPLIPIFAGLSALGALGGGAAGIAKAVNDAKDAKQKLEESKRHNVAMEQIAMGLISFESYNSIPNIEKNKNDKFYYGSEGEYIVIPEGNYNVDSINKYIQRSFGDFRSLDDNDSTRTGIVKAQQKLISITANNNTLKCKIKCSEDIDFTKEDSIGHMLGFKPRKLPAFINHQSDFPVDIFNVNNICVECNIVGGSYVNDKQAHVIHEFFPKVPAGFKIIEAPNNVVYLPINTRIIDQIVVNIISEDGELINFGKELVSVRLHLKEA